MKRIFAVISIILALSSLASAIGRQEDPSRTAASLQPVYQNDGDTADWFNVTATSDAWNVVKGARDERRRLRIQLSAGSVFGVCIGSITDSASPCDDTTPGVELSTGAVGPRWIDLVGESTVTCRARANSSGERLKGFEAYDSGD